MLNCFLDSRVKPKNDNKKKAPRMTKDKKRELQIE